MCAAAEREETTAEKHCTHVCGGARTTWFGLRLVWPVRGRTPIIYHIYIYIYDTLLRPFLDLLFRTFRYYIDDYATTAAEYILRIKMAYDLYPL